MAKVQARTIHEGEVYLSTSEAVRVLGDRNWFYNKVRGILFHRGEVWIENQSSNAPRWYREEAVLKFKAQKEAACPFGFQRLTKETDEETCERMKAIRNSPNHPRRKFDTFDEFPY